jgi:DNA polymerase elongation subunit (family B)
MLAEIELRDIIFIDIETVPQYASFELLPERFRQFWDKKSSYFRKEDQEADQVYERAGIYSEFGKIICISAGVFTKEKEPQGFRIKSYFGNDEKEILVGFSSMLEKYTEGRTLFLCAHNGKEFDFPYISRRMLVNGLKLPAILDMAGKKPWEIKHLDTMELWKFGDYKNYTSLDLLTAIFEIPSPKNDMDGSMVAKVFWEDKNIERIADYCQNDVLAIAQLMLRYKGMSLLSAEKVEIVND